MGNIVRAWLLFVFFAPAFVQEKKASALLYKNHAVRLILLLRKYPFRFGFSLLLLLSWWFCLPSPLFHAPLSTVLLDERGHLLSAQIATDGQWRIPAADSLSPALVAAVTTFEDRRFFQHWGVDPRAFARAMRDNWRAGKVVSGGSTLSMQLIRLAKNNPPRTLWQKAVEALQATRLELTYSKEDILKMWCDHAPFGGNTVGVETAAWRYFQRPATSLSWAEAAMLAVLPNSPGLIHPGRSRDALLAKRDRLLDQLQQTGYLTEEDLQLAKAETLPLAPKPLPRYAPHLLHRLDKSIGKGRHTSSLEGQLQRDVNRIIQTHHEQLSGNEIANLAAMVIEVSSAQTKAYVANVPQLEAVHSPAVDLITAPRSPGSLLKPLLYGLALTEGHLSPQQLLLDVPVSFRGFYPANFNESFSGAVPANQALARSLNIPFVLLLQSYGVPKMHESLRHYGFSYLTRPPEHYGLSLVLGGCEINMEQIASWFLGLSRQQRYYYPRQGMYSHSDWEKPSYLAHIQRDPMEKLHRQTLAIDAGAGYHVLKALQALERPDEEGNWQRFEAAGQISWKTGTSFGFRDAWAVGTNGRYVVAVWAGNASGEGRPGLVGTRAAAPVLFDIFRQLAPAGEVALEIPYDAMIQARICQQSGHLAGPYCPGDTLWCPKQVERAPRCPHHQLIHLTADAQYRAHQECAPPGTALLSQAWFSLPPTAAYYYRKEQPTYRKIPPWHPQCQSNSGSSEQRMQMIYPHSSSRISAGQDWFGRPMPFIFELAHSYPEKQVHWHLDGQFIGSTRDFHTFELLPAAGRHLLVLTDEDGHSLDCSFEVL